MCCIVNFHIAVTYRIVVTAYSFISHGKSDYYGDKYVPLSPSSPVTELISNAYVNTTVSTYNITEQVSLVQL